MPKINVYLPDELAEAVRSAARRPRGRGIDAATLTFQALRIHVNRELEGLGDVLASLSGISLAAGGPAQRDQARRLLDLLMDGLRYRATSPR